MLGAFHINRFNFQSHLIPHFGLHRRNAVLLLLLQVLGSFPYTSEDSASPTLAQKTNERNSARIYSSQTVVVSLRRLENTVSFKFMGTYKWKCYMYTSLLVPKLFSSFYLSESFLPSIFYFKIKRKVACTKIELYSLRIQHLLF